MKWCVRLGLIGVLALAAACGGKVVVDSLEGSGGTTSTGGGPTLCADACAVLSAKYCAGADCVARCEAVGPSCAAVADTLLACLRDQSASSELCFVDACLPQRNALQTCVVGASCESPIMGPGSPGLLVGKGICGGMHEHAAVCDDKGHCDCVFDTNTLGVCNESGPFLADIAGGCCGSIFPQGG